MKTLITWFGFREDFNTDSQSLLNILPAFALAVLHVLHILNPLKLYSCACI